MFDNPLGHDWQPEKKPRVRRSIRIPLLVLSLILAGLWCLNSYSESSVTVVPSPNGMRQVEVVVTPAANVIEFYVHDAGYRLQHEHVLFARVLGAVQWHVVWQGPGGVKVSLPGGWSKIYVSEPKDLKVEVAQAGF